MNITDQKNKVRTDVIAHLKNTRTSQRRFAVNAGVDYADFNKWLKGSTKKDRWLKIGNKEIGRSKKVFSDKSLDLILTELKRQQNEIR